MSNKNNPIILKPLDRIVIRDLFSQSLIGARKGDDYIQAMERFTRLVEFELQAQLFSRAAQRMAEETWRAKRKNGRPKKLEIGTAPKGRSL